MTTDKAIEYFYGKEADTKKKVKDLVCDHAIGCTFIDCPHIEKHVETEAYIHGCSNKGTCYLRHVVVCCIPYSTVKRGIEYNNEHKNG